ncbi:hypothetical protein ACHAXR_009909 [Thalassiosira sp. AJA248-18]
MTTRPTISTGSSSHQSSAKSWPFSKDDEKKKKSTTTNDSSRRSVSLNLNHEMEQEHQQQGVITTTNYTTTTTTAGHKENFHPNNNNNFTAMKQIMKRKQMANAAREELDHNNNNGQKNNSSSQVNNNNEEDAVLVNNAHEDLNDTTRAALTIGRSDSLSLDEKDTSSWAMMGNHLNETTLDNESNIAISPEQLKQHGGGVPSEWSSTSSGSGLSSSGAAAAAGASGISGISGVLSFLGESPLFSDETITEEQYEAETNLTRSAEKVKRLEEHLLRSAADGGGMLSPVQKQPRGGGDGDDYGAAAAAVGDSVEEGGMMIGREKEVTFAIQGGWETPKGISGYSKYAKSPYVDNNGKGGGMMMTPTSKLSESMEAQANPMNESVIVSDDEASGGDNNVSPLKGIGSYDDEEEVLENEEEGDDRFETALFSTPESSLDLDSMGSSSSKASGDMEKQQHNVGSKKSSSTNTTPTRASLMKRNQTLVKEVRFADQTCVELSERKKYYKNQASQFKKNFTAATRDNSLLRENYESSLQETAKLKVLVESLQAQKHQADLQVEAYRAQITDTEKTHRSSMKKMEKSYHSHLKNSEEQIFSLNERLQQNVAANTILQSKLDELHDKWESKLEMNDAASKELISSLKERVATGNATASTADASVQALQSRLVDLQKLCDQHKDHLQRERNEREMIEHDRDDLQVQCDDLHRQLTEWVQTSDTLGDVFFNEDGSRNEDFVEGLKEYTPMKQLGLDFSGISSSSIGGDNVRNNSGAHHPRTPTSNLLARTLRSELKHRQSVSEKLDHAEQKVAKLKDKIADMKMDHEEAKADNALLEEDLEEKCIRVAELEEELEEKDDQISRLNEEIEVLCQVEGGVSSASDVESSRESSRSSESSKRDTVSVLEQKLDAVEETLEFADDELVETKARLADTQELLDQTAGQLERSEDELAEARDEVSDYKAQVENLLEGLTEKEAECVNISKFSDFQTSTLDAMKDKLSQSDTANAELRLQLQSCFQSLVALHKILRTYEAMDGIVGQRMAEQSRKVGRLLETLQQFVQERESTRDLESGELTPLKNDEQSVFNASMPECVRCPHYQKQLDELRLKVLTAEIEREDANKKIEKAHSVLQEFKDELSKQESEHLQETASLKSQCEELEAKLSAVTSDLTTCEKKNQDLSKTAASSENAVSQQLSVTRSNNADLIQENQTIRVDLQGCEFQLENERALLRATREEADGYRQDVSNAKAAFECLTTECDLTKASLSKLEKEAQGLREVVTKKEKELKESQESSSKAQATFQDEIESLKYQCDDLAAKISVEEGSRLSAEASLDDASRHIATLEDAIKTKEEECQEKQSECQELLVQVKQIQSVLAETEKEKSEADAATERLESEIQEKKSVLFAYEESIISYKDDIRRLNNELQTTVSEKNNRIQMLEQGLHSRQTLFTEQLDRTKKERDASTTELTEMIERLKNELIASNKLHQESGERAKMDIEELEEEILEQNEAQRDLEEEILRRQDSLEEETKKYEGACAKLDAAQNEIAQVTDRLNSFEMDRERMASKHQDDMEELAEERNRLEGEKIQLEEQIHLLQANIEEVDEIRGQMSHEISGLSTQNASLQKKCNIFKEKVKSLNEKNRAWEDSYKAQSDDFVQHGMEILRLNSQVSELKSQLIVCSGRYVNQFSASAQTPQGRTNYPGHPGTM